jgi:hypothetical protein
VLRVKLGIFLALAVLAWGELPECNLAPGWQQFGPRRTYEGESLYEYMNGNSEGYLIFGFRKMTGVTCKKGGTSILIDVSDMGDPESAFGIFSANRDVRSPAAAIGMGGQVVPRKAIVAKGQYYLEIAAEPEGDHRQMLTELATSLAAQVSGTCAPPEALNWFPASGMQPGFPRLIPQSVLGIRILKRGYVAQYENGAKAFIFPDASPEAAAATLEKLKARLTEVSVGELGFVGKDKYLGKMAIFQKGRYIAGFSGLPETANPSELTGGLTARIH